MSEGSQSLTTVDSTIPPVMPGQIVVSVENPNLQIFLRVPHLLLPIQVTSPDQVIQSQ